MNNIREYLVAEAARITDAAGMRFASGEELLAARPAMRARYFEMMGIPELPPAEERPPLNVKITGTTDYPAYTIERLYYEALPQLYVCGNLYVPRNISFPAPAVAYFCGHAAAQREHYQPHPRRWAELGFVTLIVDTIEAGENKGEHHGPYERGWFNWYSRGYTAGGVELLNGIRGVDLLVSRPEVDLERIGVTGISGGGAMSWYLGAGDERVKAIAPVCGTGTLRSHLADRSLDGHCDCMFFTNYYQWDLADLAALIAPRPLFIGSADRDGIYRIESIRECYQRARLYYELLDAVDKIALAETPGGHSYHAKSRQGIFSWFFRHLCGKEIPPEQIRDVDANGVNPAPPEHLRVYVNGLPADERVSTIDASFVPRAAAPVIRSAADLKQARDGVFAQLRATTFRHFPFHACNLDFRVTQEHEVGTIMREVAFTPEPGWRLRGTLVLPEESRQAPSPALLHLTHPRRGRGQWWSQWGGMSKQWMRLFVETRGVGEASWGSDLAWTVRRGCAIIGRTVASLRVYDALRAMEMVRSLPESNGEIALLGADEMAVPALFAALLDGNVRALGLIDPPATLDVTSPKDGNGPTTELLGALRFLDLPVALGLLWPAELIFIGDVPAEYAWAEEVYARLGAPGKITRLKSMSEWQP